MTTTLCGIKHWIRTRKNIGWADAEWNPVRGCSYVSSGCQNCYGAQFGNRFCGEYYGGQDMGAPYAGFVSQRRWTGRVELLREKLRSPLAQTKRSLLVAVNRVSDTFHEALTESEVWEMLNNMAAAPHHAFLVLTKRIARVRDLLCKAGRALPGNVWIGVSAEDQGTADERLPLLLQIPAAKRFAFLEPLLGPVDISPYLSGSPRLDWVAAGGEIGSGARPVRPEWVRSIRDSCVSAGVPFYFLRWSGTGDRPGRLLDGREWNERIRRDG